MRIFAVLIFSCISLFAFSQKEAVDVRAYIEKGNALYDSLDYRSAATQYKHACILNPNSHEAWFNFATALYKLDKFILSSEAFSKSFELTNDTLLQSKIQYGLGNCMAQLEEYEKALNLYQKALMLNPADDDARYNYVYVKNILDSQNENQQNPEEKDDKKEEKEKNEPSELAQQVIKQVQDLVNKNQFVEANALLQESLQKDKTIQEHFGELISKVQSIAEIIENSKK